MNIARGLPILLAVPSAGTASYSAYSLAVPSAGIASYVESIASERDRPLVAHDRPPAQMSAG